MRGKLPNVIKLPPSVTVPFGSFEEALKAKENSDVSKRLEAAVKDIPSSHAEEKLSKCRDIVMEVLHLLLSFIHSFTGLLHGDGFAAACALTFQGAGKEGLQSFQSCKPTGKRRAHGAVYMWPDAYMQHMWVLLRSIEHLVETVSVCAGGSAAAAAGGAEGSHGEGRHPRARDRRTLAAGPGRPQGLSPSTPAH